MESPPEDVVSQIFDVLRHPSRRRILLTVYRHDEPGAASFTPADFLPQAADRERFQSELRHTHLPKLADSGYIDWDRTQELIEPGPQFEELRPFLDLVEKFENQSSHTDEWGT